MTKKETLIQIKNLIEMVFSATTDAFDEEDIDTWWVLGKLGDDLLIEYATYSLFWSDFKEDAEAMVSKWKHIVEQTMGRHYE